MPLSRRGLLRTASLAAVGPLAALDRSEAAVRRTRRPTHFVLVHGSFHGAWCWYKTAAVLEARGHRVTAVDLPSAGIDPTPAADVTLAQQAAGVVDVLDSLDAPVVLVGHSAGGPVVSMAADARPAAVAKLAFVTAALLPAGTNIAGTLAQDPDSLVLPNLVGNPDGSLSLRPESVRDVFYGRSDDADVALARALLKPVGLHTTIDPVVIGDGFESVRRFYVACRRDRAIGIALQRAMVEAMPCERVFTLDTDHSPFFSRPAALTRILDSIARA